MTATTGKRKGRDANMNGLRVDCMAVVMGNKIKPRERLQAFRTRYRRLNSIGMRRFPFLDLSWLPYMRGKHVGMMQNTPAYFYDF